MSKLSPTEIMQQTESPVDDSNRSEKASDTASDAGAQWNGETDTDNPRNWPASKKRSMVVYASAICVTVSMSVSLMTPAVPNISEALHVNEVKANLGYSLFVSGWAIGPLVFGPLSEIYGRNAIYQPAWIIFIAFQIGAALARNIATLVVCRFLAGLAGAPAIVNSSGTIADIYTVEEQGIPFGMLVMVAYLSPTIGPILGGYIAEFSSWRWTFWVSVIMAGILLVPTFMAPETHGETILRKRALKEGRQLSKDTVNSNDRRLRSRRNFVAKALTRPFRLLFGELLILLSSLYVGLMSGILYLYFAAYPLIFRGTYKFSQGDAGLPFFALSLGVLISIVTAGIGTKMYLKRKAERGGIALPEDRLLFALPASVIAPISIFWLFWSSFSDIHWIAPTISGVFFGWSLLTLFVCQFTYLADSYADVVASANAAMYFMRSVFTVAFPLFAPAMNNNLGIHWAGSVLGFLTLTFTPVPFLFYKYGPWIRTKSPYTSNKVRL